MAKWYIIPDTLPLDNETVWIRRIAYTHAFLAEWHLAAAEFETATGLILPWYAVYNWKSQ